MMRTQRDLSTLESLAFAEMPQRTYIFLKITVLTPTGTVTKDQWKNSGVRLEYKQ